MCNRTSNQEARGSERNFRKIFLACLFMLLSSKVEADGVICLVPRDSLLSCKDAKVLFAVAAAAAPKAFWNLVRNKNVRIVISVEDYYFPDRLKDMFVYFVSVGLVDVKDNLAINGKSYGGYIIDRYVSRKRKQEALYNGLGRASRMLLESFE